MVFNKLLIFFIMTMPEDVYTERENQRELAISSVGRIMSSFQKYSQHILYTFSTEELICWLSLDQEMAKVRPR